MNKYFLVPIATLILYTVFKTFSRVSKDGLSFIKTAEGLKVNPYKDSGGKWTVGYGHLIKFPKEKVLMQGITKKQAENLLIKDIADTERAISKYVKVSLTQPQYDALVSLIYNIGEGAFKHSTLLTKLNSNDYQGAANEFPRWRYVNKAENAGLLGRRAKEQSIFMS